MKYEVYMVFIDDDYEFEEEEVWLVECQENFIEIEYWIKVYLDMCDEGKGKFEIDGKGVLSKEMIYVVRSEGILVMYVISIFLYSISNESDSDIIQIILVFSDFISSSVNDINQNIFSISGMKYNCIVDIIQIFNFMSLSGGVI